MGVTAGIFLASILLKEMRYLVYIYKISMVNMGGSFQLGHWVLFPPPVAILGQNSLISTNTFYKTISFIHSDTAEVYIIDGITAPILDPTACTFLYNQMLHKNIQP